jgi:hypothetical protein
VLIAGKPELCIATHGWFTTQFQAGPSARRPSGA